MKKYYVYIHYNKDKPFYIGKGTGRRYYDVNHRNKHWRNTVNKYNNIRFEKVTTLMTEEDAYELEEFIISEIGLDNLTNVSKGGGFGGGYDVSGKNNPMYGKVHPNKGKSMPQNGHQGRVGQKHTKDSNLKNALSQKTRVEVIIEGITYNSFTEAAKCLGIYRSTFTRRYKRGFYDK
tara:strand:- start:47 stop:577 length:531 start_codon:yes stop_codon:yes gene_type:complete